LASKKHAVLSLSSSKFQQSQLWTWLWRFLNFLFKFFEFLRDNPIKIFLYVSLSSPSYHLLLLSLLITFLYSPIYQLPTIEVPIFNRMAEFEPSHSSDVKILNHPKIKTKNNEISERSWFWKHNKIIHNLLKVKRKPWTKIFQK